MSDSKALSHLDNESEYRRKIHDCDSDSDSGSESSSSSCSNDSDSDSETSSSSCSNDSDSDSVKSDSPSNVKKAASPMRSNPSFKSQNVRKNLSRSVSSRSKSEEEKNKHTKGKYSDEYDEEEEDYEENNRPQKKKRKKAVFDFIIQEAEVDDESEDEDEWEEVKEIGIAENEVEEAGLTAREIDGQRREINSWSSQEADKIEEYFKNKYQHQESAIVNRFGDGGEQISYSIAQQNLLPSIKDPNLWLIKCRVGEERNTVLLLMRKYLTYSSSNQPLLIKSVIVPTGLKGCIYIEAYKQPHIKAAIENVGNLKMGLLKQQMVPINEMTDVLRVVKKQSGLIDKQWVRLNRGVFKGDIAQVQYVDSARDQVYLKLLPRIDYTRPRGMLKTAKNTSEAVKRKRKQIPVAKLFDLVSIKAIGGTVTSDGDYLIFEGNRYSHQGFLYKHFSISAIISHNVKPTLSELEKFEEAPEDLRFELSDASRTNGTTSAINHTFNTGDNVVVCEGELINLKGKIVSIHGNIVMMMPKHEDLKKVLKFQANELKKLFITGDHVKVIAGRYEGDTGIIVRVDSDRIFLYSDLSMHEIEVLPRDLQLCTDVTTGVDSSGRFQWGDLVELDSQTVGVVIRLERENLHVLSMHSKNVKVRSQGLKRRKENPNTRALDFHQNTIQRKDMVKVVDGPHSGREGQIKHLYRCFAFLHSRTFIDNGGIFVCKTRHLKLLGGNNTSSANEFSSEKTIDPLGLVSSCIASPMHPSGTGNRGSGSSRDRGYCRDRGWVKGGKGAAKHNQRIIGSTIKITGGPYKGNVGIVKKEFDTSVSIELYTNCQTILVSKSHIAKDSASTKNEEFNSNKTPAYQLAGKTPIYQGGSRTPLISSMTPMHNADPVFPGQYDAWDPTVSNTPARFGDFD